MKTYEEWKLQRGESAEIGTQMIVSHKLTRAGLPVAIKKATDMLSETLIKGLIREGGIKPRTITFDIANDPERAYELTVTGEGMKEADALSYLFVAEEGWRKEYAARVAWENRPLFSYISHAFFRTRIGRWIQDKWEGRK